MKLRTFILLLSFIIVATAGAYLLIEKPDCIFGSKEAFVSNFEECIVAGYAILESYPRQCKTPQGKSFTENIGNELEKIDLIRADNPRPNQIIESPLVIRGEARGYWFFEADFPIKLFDVKGNLIALTVARASSEWMTEEFVSFEAILEFQNPAVKKGNLILQKDNPSGLPEYADELIIPIYFKVED